ncbi:uncharacterized protein OCT59_010128 [Rhizophagus irregularis]|uniref:F-box domain-containing protein n=1 Tax=Rhizophagus irregularis (strain DAOM 197198w) TaxID=1432141 RepID=A0A015NAG0_RHIIW|nr:hypothetical protein RirG_035590 [Rhizophagus irregularis DAOM 197198w]UZO18819.1 hypothetical protein OCT59_010128 [Rhizophagus irregularis]
MPEFNRDILFLIFEELQEDSKSLFSCLMINRLWCETVVPILWKDPWRYNIKYANKNFLYSIITSYLSNDIKEFLTREGTQISNQSLTFDYLSFCKSINVNIINNIISIGTASTFKQFLLQQEFYNIMIRKRSELKCLNMISLKHQIFNFPDAKAYLETLCELKCDTSIESSYFYGLAFICQNIQRLTIINNVVKANYGVAKLIEVQRNLKYFEWEDDFDEDYFTEEDPYEKVLLALEKNVDNINHLKIILSYVEDFEHILLMKLFPKFHKLKTLIIEDFNFIIQEQLKTSVYRDLEVLELFYISLDVVSIMIENSGGHLREILLEYDYLFEEDNFNEDSLILIRKIHEHCPLVERLSLAFSPSEQHFTEFEKLLKVCRKLKSLLIIPYFKEFKKNYEYGEELLKIIIRSSSTNLREIRFFEQFILTLKTLEEFFENWRGRPALTIFTSNPIYEEEDYVKLINKYKKDDGVIKDFRYKLFRDLFNFR